MGHAGRHGRGFILSAGGSHCRALLQGGNSQPSCVGHSQMAALGSAVPERRARQWTQAPRSSRGGTAASRTRVGTRVGTRDVSEIESPGTRVDLGIGERKHPRPEGLCVELLLGVCVCGGGWSQLLQRTPGSAHVCLRDPIWKFLISCSRKRKQGLRKAEKLVPVHTVVRADTGVERGPSPPGHTLRRAVSLLPALIGDSLVPPCRTAAQEPAASLLPVVSKASFSVFPLAPRAMPDLPINSSSFFNLIFVCRLASVTGPSRAPDSTESAKQQRPAQTRVFAAPSHVLSLAATTRGQCRQLLPCEMPTVTD